MVNVVRRGSLAECSRRIDRDVSSAHIIINLRAEAAPETVEHVVKESLGHIGWPPVELRIRLDGLECFRPGAPVPTHNERLSA